MLQAAVAEEGRTAYRPRGSTIAEVKITPPEKFTFSRPEEWTKWIRRFQTFRQASGLAEKTEVNQIDTLIYTMGDEAEDILGSFCLTAEEGKKYDTVVTKFEGYFIKRRNLIFERAMFNRRKQEDGEPVENFTMDLYRLAEHCKYGLFEIALSLAYIAQPYLRCCRKMRT